MKRMLSAPNPNADVPVGLTAEEARRRLEAFGPNEVSSPKVRTRLREFAKFFLDPMGLMLLGLAALYLALGDKTDSIILMVAWLPVTAVDMILELRAGAALRALKATLNPVAKVLRDGRVLEVPTREIVPGDVLVFEEGQSLPADGKVFESDHLAINEAALTGESLPAEKTDEAPFFAGTHVVAGRALGLVEKTGRDTRFGGIARALEDVKRVASPLKKKVDHLVRWVLIVASLLAAFLLALEIYRTRSLIPSLIVALTFGMSAVPEEFPLVFTLYLSLGAWRLSRQRVLVKSLPSVETLGNADVLCTDKTGTLTEGRFQLETIVPLAGANAGELGLSALLACEIHPVDSLETAVFEKERSFTPRLRDWALVWDYPFEKTGKHMTHVWRNEITGSFRAVMKGAIEGVLEHCQLSAESRRRVDEEVLRLSSQGKRLLGLAWRDGGATGNRSSDERGMQIQGILVFSDPIRPSAIEAIARCQAAGIEVKMLTGDHPLTAHTIADQVGIAHKHDRMFSGADLTKLGAKERADAYLKGAIFSRVLPEHKHELVKALQDSGKVVAMTGDGINDAPALKLADVGISMGHTATDVARSAAQIVLLDSDFSGIVSVMLEGRRVLSCLRHSFGYLISFHVPVVLLTLIPPFLGWPALLLPVHIILLELVVHPVSAFTFENMPVSLGSRQEERTRGMIDSRRLVQAGLSGLLVSVAALLCFEFFLPSHGEPSARAIGLSAVLLGNIAFVLAEAMPALGSRVFATALILLSFVLLLTWAGAPFLHLAPMGFSGLIAAAIAGGLGFVPSLTARLLRRMVR